MSEPTPEHVYQAVAQDRYYRWGYNETIPHEEIDYVTKQAADPNLRADADIVWQIAKGDTL